MRKNKMMRFASALLIMTLLSTSVISGTFAKYVTTNSGADSARVAKFGVEITAATDMFYNSYEDTFKTYTAGEGVMDITVQASSADEDIIAPGTEGTLAGFKVTGIPEVDVEVTYEADLVLDNWIINDASEYCPIEITVNGEAFKIGSVPGITTTALLENAVENAIEAKAKYYHTNTDLSAEVYDDVVVSWKWAYEGNDDEKDTQLGNRAAAGYPATIELTITTTVTQVD